MGVKEEDKTVEIGLELDKIIEKITVANGNDRSYLAIMHGIYDAYQLGFERAVEIHKEVWDG